jgi:tetratricopeptide (TPR) repeat protein
MSKEDLLSLIDQGKQLYERGCYEEVLTVLERVLTLDASHLKAHNAKGVTLGQLGRYQEAIEAFDHAIRLSPDDAVAYFNKTLAPQQLGAYQEALMCCEKSLECDPGNATAHDMRGLLLWSLGRQEEALQTFDQAIACNPEFLPAWHHKADVLALLARTVEAEQAYKRAYALSIQLQQAQNVEAAPPVSPVTLEQQLLTLGGQRMVYRYEPDLEALLSRGEVFEGQAELVPGASRDCHANAARRWSEQKEGLAIVTGYVLSEDDLWRQHSWLLRKHPTANQCHLLETTVERVKYFGVILTESEAEAFFQMNA